MTTPAPARAPGDIDTSFGDAGILTLPAGFTSMVARLSDGKLLVVGDLDNDVALLRLLPDGTTDSTFGTDGLKRIYTRKSDETAIRKFAAFPDGSLVLQGQSGGLDTYLLRTLPSGELDSRFGNAGHSLLALQGGPNTVTTVAAQPDGKVVLVVRVHPTIEIFEGWLVRLANGRLDPTFGGGAGMVHIGTQHMILDLLVLPDGRLLMAGQLNIALLFVQYHGDGRLDTAFGENGFVVREVEQARRAMIEKILRQADGKIAAVGAANSDLLGSSCLTTRLLADGSQDPSFNDGEPYLDNFTGVGAQNLAIIQQKDGKLVTAGTLHGTSESSHVILMRFNQVTGLDETFGDQGRVLTQLGGFDAAPGLFLQEDGRILAAAVTFPSPTLGMIIRYLP